MTAKAAGLQNPPVTQALAACGSWFVGKAAGHKGPRYKSLRHSHPPIENHSINHLRMLLLARKMGLQGNLRRGENLKNVGRPINMKQKPARPANQKWRLRVWKR
jgi:hypothetical protein